MSANILCDNTAKGHPLSCCHSWMLILMQGSFFLVAKIQQDMRLKVQSIILNIWLSSYCQRICWPLPDLGPLTDFCCTYLERERRRKPHPDIVSTDGKTFMDYAFYDNMNIPALYLNLKLDGTWDARKQYARRKSRLVQGAEYFYRSYETGRRLAAIVNIMLAVGDAHGVTRRELNSCLIKIERRLKRLLFLLNLR